MKIRNNFPNCFDLFLVITSQKIILGNTSVTNLVNTSATNLLDTGATNFINYSEP